MAAFVIFVSMVLANLVVLGGATSHDSCVTGNVNRTNWAANVVYSRDCLQEAGSVQKIRALVRSDRNLKVIGMRHCFTTIADNEYNQLSLLSMHKVVALDVKARTVTVDAGITYTQLCPYLDRKGFALHNLASFTDLSVAGAISTATHGSGVRNGNLPTAVAALEFVTAKGDVVKFSRERDGEVFRGVVVGLGALGVITRITLDIQPAYTMRQWVYENLPLSEMKENFDAIMSSGYSVNLFTDWQKQRINQVWINTRVGYGKPFAAPKKYFGATLATRNLSPEGGSAENMTEQMGIPGPWYLRLPHFSPGTIVKVGNQLQSEYFVPRKKAVDAILAVEKLRDQIGPHLIMSEIRVVAADKLWMSTAYRRESVGIHFSWKKDVPAVHRLLSMIEKELAPFRPRPHWGKLFTMAPSKFHSTYDRLDDFVRLAAKYDPTGKFRNDFLNTNVFSTR